jgi:hypothetical protein
MLNGRTRRIRYHNEIERYCVALEAAIGWRPSGRKDLDIWCIAAPSTEMPR